MHDEHEHLKKIAHDLARDRDKSREQACSYGPVREAEQRAIRSLTKAANYVASRTKPRQFYDHDASGLHHTERFRDDMVPFYEEQGTTLEAVNRDLCAMWIQHFWLDAAEAVAACMEVAELEDLVLRTREQDLGMALFLPLVAVEGRPDEELLDRTIRALADLRLTLGRSQAGLEAVFGLIAAELYRGDSEYHEQALADSFDEAPIGLDHLWYELDQWQVFDEHDRICHAPDFSWVVTGDKRHVFTRPVQRRIVEELWKTWEASGRRDGSPLTQDRLAELIGSVDQLRVDKAFRDNSAWDTIVRRVAKGQFALFLKSTPDSPAEAQ